MEKKKYAVITVMAFAVALITSAMLGGTTQCEELAFLQDSMRELRRTDNVEFSYKTTICSGEARKSEEVLVWADQLTGSWVSEHYVTDEDGKRLYLRSYCDGRNIYYYSEWSGEWELQTEEDTDIPYFENMITLTYDRDDITDIKITQEGQVQQLSYQFTPEYVQSLNDQRQQNMEEYYAKYKKMQTEEEALEKVELAVEQYRRTKEEDTAAIYRVDSAGVLRNVVSTMNLVSPQIIEKDGIQTLGEDVESSYLVEVEILRYNQDGILNKIEFCRNEAAYYQ